MKKTGPKSAQKKKQKEPVCIMLSAVLCCRLVLEEGDWYLEYLLQRLPAGCDHDHEHEHEHEHDEEEADELFTFFLTPKVYN